jgi:hypothetical protein
MQKERLYAPRPIAGGLIQAGEFVIIDPENPGILVGRWLDWRHLSFIRRDRRRLVSASSAPFHLVPVSDPPPGRQLRHLTLLP